MKLSEVFPDLAPIDWSATKKAILARLDVAAEYAAMGIVFTRDAPNQKGWRECKAIHRQDRKPSAGINVLTGAYSSKGEGAETLPFFDFATRYGNLGGWKQVIEHFAAKAGVEIPRVEPRRDGLVEEAVYPYRDADGRVVYEVVRYRSADGGKTFRQRHPDDKGGFVWSMNGIVPVPYRLPELLAADADDPIFVVEGEKDVERAASEGLIATCNHQGSGNTRVWADLAPLLAGRDVYVIPDNDEPGRKHAVGVAGHLHPVARQVKIVDLPDLPPKGDLSDFLDDGGSIDVLGRLAHTAPAWSPEKQAADDGLDLDATAADLIRLDSTIRWVWPNWIPIGVLTILASEPGVGKTRLCGDLLKRIHLGLPWPDGSPQGCPPGSVALWVPADNQHPELGTIPTSFGFPPEALYLNATRRNPFVGTMLDAPEDLKDFEARILRIRPVFIFIDTSLNATDRSAHKPEDAKAFFKPLQEIAARTQTAIVCVTHLNAGGKPLGRRITGQGRVVIQLERPDPDNQPDRRKLYVTKSHSLIPPALGVTMGGAGNEYDANPPVAPEINEGPKVFKINRLDECCEWLRERLDSGSERVFDLRRAAEEAGFSSKTIYAARDRLGIHEFELEGKKYWQLTDDRPF